MNFEKKIETLKKYLKDEMRESFIIIGSNYGISAFKDLKTKKVSF